jgi:hypothetical protein
MIGGYGHEIYGIISGYYPSSNQYNVRRFNTDYTNDGVKNNDPGLFNNLD